MRCTPWASTSFRGTQSSAAASASCCSAAVLLLCLCTVSATRPHSAAQRACDREQQRLHTTPRPPRRARRPCRRGPPTPPSASPRPPRCCPTPPSRPRRRPSPTAPRCCTTRTMLLPAVAACRESACLPSTFATASSAASFSFHSRHLRVVPDLERLHNEGRRVLPQHGRRVHSSTFLIFFSSDRGFVSSLSPATVMRSHGAARLGLSVRGKLVRSLCAPPRSACRTRRTSRCSTTQGFVATVESFFSSAGS